MTPPRQITTESRWARVGVLLNSTPARREPDLERLLLDTARALPAGGNARLLPLTVTWLVQHGLFVARHRLARLAAAELDPQSSPTLGLLLEVALHHGGPTELRACLAACRPLSPPRPLSPDFASTSALVAVAQRNASETSRQWGLWTPDIALKADAIRPVSWLLSRNPSYRGRIIRKGDLRVSILQSLRWDAGGRTHSESELARLSGATRAAVRKALRALVLEGEVIIVPNADNARDHAVELRTAA